MAYVCAQRTCIVQEQCPLHMILVEGGWFCVHVCGQGGLSSRSRHENIHHTRGVLCALFGKRADIFYQLVSSQYKQLCYQSHSIPSPTAIRFLHDSLSDTRSQVLVSTLTLLSWSLRLSLKRFRGECSSPYSLCFAICASSNRTRLSWCVMIMD